METAHIALIITGTLLVVCVGLWLYARREIRIKNGALNNYHRDEYRHIQAELRWEKEKKELEAKLKPRPRAKRGTPAAAKGNG
jgi:ABC-type nickel/cobalt efflux system permease component RcnA